MFWVESGDPMDFALSFRRATPYIKIKMPTTNAVSTNLSFTPKVSLRRRSLTTRFWDFWLLGGLSLVVFAVMMLVEVHYAYIFLVLPLLQIAIEFPHLIASYKLAYSPNRGFVRKHPLRLVALPLVLIAGFVYLAIYPENQAGWTAMIGLLFFSVGWHRSRQAYGCMVMYSQFDDYNLRPAQKRVINWMLNATWISGYLSMMAYPRRMEFFGAPVPQWEVPAWLLFAAHFALFIGLTAFVTGVLGWKIWKERKLPSANFLVPWVAVSVWFASYLYNPDYFLYLTATFHSLQYLAFVAAYGREGQTWKRFGVSALLLIIAGYLVMRFVPQQLQGYLGFGVLGVYIFVSLHHYVLDSIIWKTSDPLVRRKLLGGA